MLMIIYWNWGTRTHSVISIWIIKMNSSVLINKNTPNIHTYLQQWKCFIKNRNEIKNKRKLENDRALQKNYYLLKKQRNTTKVTLDILKYWKKSYSSDEWIFTCIWLYVYTSRNKQETTIQENTHITCEHYTHIAHPQRRRFHFNRKRYINTIKWTWLKFVWIHR